MLQLARPEDRSVINKLALQAHSLHAAWYPDIYEQTEELWTQQRFDAAVADRQLFCAKIENLVVGYVLLNARSCEVAGHVKRKILVIDEICVDEKLRNRGIGTEMMLGVRAIAKAFGCSNLQLGVYPQNNEAIAFYQKCGFRIHSIDMQARL